MNAVFQYAIRHGIILTHPAAHIERPTVCQPKIQVPSLGEFQKIVATIRQAPQSWRGFEHDDRTLTGGQNLAGEPCVFQIAIGGENKWGSELRIYIPERFRHNPRLILPANLKLVADHVPNLRRINNNEFWWFLVERLKFRAGKTQNLQEIEARLPNDFRESFRQGCQTV